MSKTYYATYYAFTNLYSICIAISFSRWVYYDSITESDVVGIHDTMRINDDGSLRIQGPILREKYRSQMLLGCRRAKSGMRSPILVNLTYEKGKNSRSKSEKPFFWGGRKKKMERDLRKRGCLHIKFRTWNLKGYVVSMDMVYDWVFS